MSIELQLLCAVLATWRLAHLLAHEDGPFDFVVKLRQRAGASLWGQWMDCSYCSSFYLAAPFAFWPALDGVSRFVFWLATAGGACVLQRYAPEPSGSEPSAPLAVSATAKEKP